MKGGSLLAKSGLNTQNPRLAVNECNGDYRQLTTDWPPRLIVARVFVSAVSYSRLSLLSSLVETAPAGDGCFVSLETDPVFKSI